MDQDEKEFLDAAIIGARGLANRQGQRVTVVHNTFKHRLQPFFITMVDKKQMEVLPDLRPYLYILPDKDKCPVVRKARDERERHALQYRKRRG